MKHTLGSPNSPNQQSGQSFSLVSIGAFDNHIAQIDANSKFECGGRVEHQNYAAASVPAPFGR
jgi:hypothetical protein